MYRGWTQRDYQNKHYNINPKDEGTLDDRGRDGGTNFILRIKEQETRLTLQEHDDDDDDEFLITSFTALKFRGPKLQKIDTCLIDCIEVGRNIVKESDCFPKRS